MVSHWEGLSLRILPPVPASPSHCSPFPALLCPTHTHNYLAKVQLPALLGIYFWFREGASGCMCPAQRHHGKQGLPSRQEPGHSFPLHHQALPRLQGEVKWAGPGRTEIEPRRM